MKRIITLMSFCLLAGTMLNGQAFKVDAAGMIGVNTGTPTVRLDIPEHNVNDNIAEIGSYGIQSFNSTNGFLTHNCFFDFAQSPTGSAMVMRETGPGSLAQFYDGRIIYRTVPNGNAGDVVGFTEALTIQNRGSVQIGYPWSDDRGAGGIKLDVNGTVAVNGIALTSDKRLKKNMTSFDKGLKEVMALNPINYQYNGKAGISDKSMHVGIVAQELQKVAPELTSTFSYDEGKVVNPMTGDVSKSGNSKDYLRINDTGIKYMLINAVKEQQGMIEDLQDQNKELRGMVEELMSSIAKEGTTNLETTLGASKVASLSQNAPNPFKGTTSLEYFIPANSKKASIAIYSNSGQLMKTVDINHTGAGNLAVDANELPSGSYRYMLTIDGQKVDTKSMTLIR